MNSGSEAYAEMTTIIPYVSTSVLAAYRNARRLRYSRRTQRTVVLIESIKSPWHEEE